MAASSQYRSITLQLSDVSFPTGKTHFSQSFTPPEFFLFPQLSHYVLFTCLCASVAPSQPTSYPASNEMKFPFFFL